MIGSNETRPKAFGMTESKPVELASYSDYLHYYEKELMNEVRQYGTPGMGFEGPGIELNRGIYEFRDLEATYKAVTAWRDVWLVRQEIGSRRDADSTTVGQSATGEVEGEQHGK